MIDLENPIARIFGSVAILTGECRTASSRNGKIAHTDPRLVAVYAQEGDATRVVHFQSTILPAGIMVIPDEAP